MIEQTFLKVLLIVLLLQSIPVIDSQSSDWDLKSVNYLNKNNEDFNSQLLNIFKDELQEMKKDLTASFIEEHTRRKRATENYEYEATLVNFQNQDVPTHIETDDLAATTVIFKDVMYVFQFDGIYRIDGLEGLDVNNETYYTSSNDTENFEIQQEGVTKVFVSSWERSPDDRVIATIEKHNVLFILIENARDGFSFLYTFNDLNQKLVLRQRIRNYGSVTAAKFFIFYDQLFLIIVNDNRVHSLTVCPIFQWMGTYLDEIHSIQTRGASAVETFVIEGYQYIAISQAIDAAGNSEVGTQVVRMNRRGELEKVQLLYSNSPVALHFTRIYHEHVLIIAQKTEPAIVYFFGGYDFIYLQHLPTLKGDWVSIVSVLAPDGETYIFASHGKQVDIFVRAPTYSPLTSLMFSPYPNSTFIAPEGYSILGLTARPPKFSYEQPIPTEDLIVSVSYAGFSRALIEFRTLVFVKKPKVASSHKQSEDKLSKCLVKLKTVLDENEPVLQQLLRSNATILRKNSDMVYNGVLNSETFLTIDSEKSLVANLAIQPDVNLEGEITMSPSQLQGRAVADISDIENTVNVRLQEVLIRDEPNELTGTLDFVNGVTIKNLNAPDTYVQLSQLNNVPWHELVHNTLRNDDGDPQVVTGNWEVNTFRAKEVWTVGSISGVPLEDVLLTQTEPNVTQIVNGPVEFKNHIEFRYGLGIPPSEYINDIQVSDIAHRHEGPFNITGTKSAKIVKLDVGTIVELVNNVYLDDWYDAVLKTNGPDQVANGTYIFNSGFFAENFHTELLNNVNWDDFISQVLIDGRIQTITDQVEFVDLVVQDLQSDVINGVKISDLLTSVTPQTVATPFLVDKLIIHGNIVDNDWINGIQLTQNVVLKDSPNVTISGPVEFHDLTVQDIDMSDRVFLSNIDITEKTKDGRTVIYRVKGNQSEPIVFAGKVYTKDAEIPNVNGIIISDFINSHWTLHGNNVVPASGINFSKFNVEIVDSFTTKLLNGHEVNEYVTINGGPIEETINSPIEFKDPVFIYGDIIFAVSQTLNDIDFSEFAQRVVQEDHQGLVRGVKTFTQPIVSDYGIRVNTINNLNINEQVVMLRNGKDHYEIPGKTQLSEVEANIVVVHGKIGNGGTVNGLDLSYIERTTVYTNEAAVISSSIDFISPSIQVQDLHLGGYLNDKYAIKNIVDTLIPLDTGNKTQYLVMNLIVQDNLEIQGPSQVGLINGVAPSEYFPALVNRSRNEVIENKKIFHGHITVANSLNCDGDTINNINLKSLEEEALSKSKDQVVNSPVIFKDLEAHNVYTSSICGIPVNDFVYIDDDTLPVINSPVTFIQQEENATTITVVEGDIELDKHLNDHNVNEVVEQLENIQGEHLFNSVTCTGSLTWNESRAYSRELSYLLNNAVLKTGEREQVVTGSVTFSSGFEANIVTSFPWINNVDLHHVANDAVYFDNMKDIEFLGKNSINTIYVEENGAVQKLPWFTSDYVDGVNIEELNRKVVRRNSNTVIRGVKTLSQPTVAEFLYTEEVNECPIDNTARINDNRIIDSLTLNSVEILHDVNFHSLDGHDWDDFIHNIVTFETAQSITGNITIHGNVTVKNCQASVINNLNVSDVVLKDHHDLQHITGEKIMNGVTIVGDIQARSINDYDIDEIYPRVLHKNKPATIDQTIYFAGPVELYKNIEVTNHINDEHSVEHITQTFETRMNEIVVQAHQVGESQVKMENLLTVLDSELKKSAVWLDYFQFSPAADDDSENTLWAVEVGKSQRVEVNILDSNYARLRFSKMIPVSSEKSGMPNDCLCNYIDFVELTPHHYKHMGSTAQCKNIFELSSPNTYATFTIMSTYISYNATCQSSTPGTTEVITLTNGKVQNHETLANVPEATPSPVYVSQIDSGFITDAKAFHSNGVDYIAISEFYDHRKGPHEGQVKIYAVAHDASLTLIQIIPTPGSVKLELALINNNWILAVANSFSKVPVPSSSSEEDGDYDENVPFETASGIYYWTPDMNNYNDYHPKIEPKPTDVSKDADAPSGTFGTFRLLREVSTKNIIDIEIIQIYRGFQDTENAFIAFLHNGNVIEIYRFDFQAQNFFLYQTLAFDDVFQITSITSFTVKDITYLVASSIPQGLIVYEYRCIEGFKQYMKVPLSEVQDITSFFLNGKILLPVASSYETFIAEGKIQGIF